MHTTVPVDEVELKVVAVEVVVMELVDVVVMHASHKTWHS